MKRRVLAVLMSLVVMAGMSEGSVILAAEPADDTVIEEAEYAGQFTPKLPVGGVSYTGIEMSASESEALADAFDDGLVVGSTVYNSLLDDIGSVIGNQVVSQLETELESYIKSKADSDSVFLKGSVMPSSKCSAFKRLTSVQKLCYVKLAEEGADFFYGDKEPEWATVGSSEYPVIAQMDKSNVPGMTSDDAMVAWMAYQADNPGFYWISNSYLQNSPGDPDNFAMVIQEEYVSSAVRDEVNAIIEEGTDRYVNMAAVGETRLDKVAIVHNGIIDAVSYAIDKETGNPSEEKSAHSVIGVFDDAYNEVVCEGYADTFSFIMNNLGIPNLYLTGYGVTGGHGSGGGHAWNLVSVDENTEKYMYMDLTWDDLDLNDINLDGGEKDLGCYISYNYFGMPVSDFEATHQSYSTLTNVNIGNNSQPMWAGDISAFTAKANSSLEGSFAYVSGIDFRTTGLGEASAEARAKKVVEVAEKYGRGIFFYTNDGQTGKNIWEKISKKYNNYSEDLGLEKTDMKYSTTRPTGEDYYMSYGYTRPSRYENPVTGITLASETVTVPVGGKIKLDVTSVTKTGETDDYIFGSVVDASVAGVEKHYTDADDIVANDITIKGLSEGETTLYITSGDDIWRGGDDAVKIIVTKGADNSGDSGQKDSGDGSSISGDSNTGGGTSGDGSGNTSGTGGDNTSTGGNGSGSDGSNTGTGDGSNSGSSSGNGSSSGGSGGSSSGGSSSGGGGGSSSGGGGGSSSGGGGGSSAASAGTTVTNSDGSKTTTYIAKSTDGHNTVTESTTYTDGSKETVVTTTDSDGGVTVTDTKKDNSGAVTYAASYSVSGSKATVNTVEASGTAVTIPATVKANGKTYKVTKLAAGFLKSNETITSVIIGKNVTAIGKNAFAGDSKLKSVTIKGNVKSVGKNAFKGIAKKAVIKVDASKKNFKKIKKALKKSGVASSVKIKRV